MRCYAACVVLGHVYIDIILLRLNRNWYLEKKKTNRNHMPQACMGMYLSERFPIGRHGLVLIIISSYPQHPCQQGTIVCFKQTVSSTSILTLTAELLELCAVCGIHYLFTFTHTCSHLLMSSTRTDSGKGFPGPIPRRIVYVETKGIKIYHSTTSKTDAIAAMSNSILFSRSVYLAESQDCV